MPATLADVARRAGVSVATASRVLNGSTRIVNADMQSRVHEAARVLHYVPNAHAQALVRERSAIIGVVVHDVSDPYFAEITRGIQQSASAAGRLVMICNSYRELERELDYVRLLHAQRVEALILAGSGLDDRAYNQAMMTQLEAFVSSGGRAAFIGRHSIPGNAVIPDNVGGARMLAHELVAMHHAHFGVINGPRLLTTSHDRLEGFRRALDELGVPLPVNQIIEGDFSRDSGVRATYELLKRNPRITAIVALNDVMAIGALAALRQMRLPVPERVSVAGFDNIPIAADVTPALTTVHVPMIELGVCAVELALMPPDTALHVEHLPTRVVIRESTAPPEDRRP